VCPLTASNAPPLARPERLPAVSAQHNGDEPGPAPEKPKKCLPSGRQGQKIGGNEPDGKAILPEPRSVKKAISYQSVSVSVSVSVV
jgi:hypothetical protein